MIPKTNHLLLKGIQIYAEGNLIQEGYLKIDREKITEFGYLNDLRDEGEYEIVHLPPHFKAIPGFIDIHIHGVDGADTMDGTIAGLETMAKALPAEGTTSFLATTMTQSVAAIEKALINASEYKDSQPQMGSAELLGIHVEGPFVNPKMAGAQPVQHIIDPDLSLLKNWQELAGNQIKLVTLAPEQPGGLEMIEYLAANGIVASVGHSDATFAEVNQAIGAGVNHVTHLFNQMKGLHHREPGVVGAAFLKEELKAELIVDGVHVHPEMVRLAYQLKRSEGLILITDSMRAKGLKDGQYDLGGQEVFVKDGKALLEDGTLAGSILKMGQAVKNMMDYTGCALEDVIVMASVNPAKQLNVYESKGSIAVGKDADIVILDENLDVYMSICRGAVAFKKEGD
jgi:N-acetylglucosamine-6-phosphate deacetylase